MSIINQFDVLKASYQGAKALGEKANSSEYTMLVDGYDSIRFLTKTFTLPIVTSTDAIEVPMLYGMKGYQPGPLKTNFEGTFVLQETTANNANAFLQWWASRGGYLNAKVYHGTPDKFFRYWQIYDAVITGEPAELDTENSTQIVTYNLTLKYMWFGEIVTGNLK